MTNIKIPTTWMGRDCEKDYEELMNRKEEEKQEQTPENSNAKSNSDFWTIENVVYNGQVYKVDLYNGLLSNGDSFAFKKWLELKKQAKKGLDFFYTGDMALQYSLFKALYNQKHFNKKEHSEARDFIQEQINKYELITTTRIKYSLIRKDKVIHEYGAGESLIKKAKLTTQFLENPEVLEALLLDGNIQNVNNVFGFITGNSDFHIQGPCDFLNRTVLFSNNEFATFLQDIIRIDHGSYNYKKFKSLGIRAYAP